MSPRQTVKTLFYLVAFTGFASLYAVPQFSKATLGMLILLAIPSWFVLRGNEPFRHYARAWNVVTIVFLLASTAEMFINHRAPHVTLAYQLSFLQLNKLFNIKRPKDYMQMWFLALMMIVIGALVSHSPLFPLLLVPFLLLTVLGFALMSLERDSMAASLVQTEQELRRRGDERFASLYRLMSATGVVALLSTAAVFIPLPRVNPAITYYSMPSPQHIENQIYLSGFTNQVQLGAMTKILQDPTVVMEVKISGKTITPDELYLRGGALDLFDGANWQKSLALRRFTEYEQHLPGELVAFGSLSETGDLVKQKTTYRNFPTNILFSLPHLVGVGGINGRVRRDMADSFILLSKERLGTYEAYSAIAQEPEDLGKSILMADAMRSFPSNSEYYSVPAQLHTSELKALAQRMTESAHDDMSKAQAIQHYLKNRYGYRLSIEAGPTENPLERFLFYDKQGYCEFFASGMVMLLRSVKIPARLVVGFHGGILDQATDIYRIRQMDAHTWVEAYIQGHGWVRFDPTPPPPLEIYSDRLVFKSLRDFYERAAVKWHQFILSYDTTWEQKLATGISERLRRLYEQVVSQSIIQRFFRRMAQNITHPAIIILAALLLAFNILVARIYYRIRRHGLGRLSLSLKGWRSIHSLYPRIVKAISGRRLKKGWAQTPREFVLALAAQKHKDRQLVDQLMDIYYAARYGGLTLRREVMEELNRLLATLAGQHR
jgi:hypothetical protein